MKNILYIIFYLSIMSCSLTKTTSYKIEKINCSILDIDDFEYVYRFKGLNTQTNDTIYILSFKQNMYDKYNYQKPQKVDKTLQIESGNNYIFSLIRMKTQVSTMQELGQYIIIEKDTLWKGPSDIIPPHYYTAQKIVDLTLFE